MFRKILLPTDGSRYAAEAARIAAQVAACHDGVVHPVVAVEYEYLSGEEVSEELSAVLRQRVEQRAQKALAEADAAVRSENGRSAPGKVLEGPAASAILKETEDGEYDLIVMGSRGVSLDSGHERLVGSVTERVLHRAPCPVLVIRAPEPG